MDGCLCGWMVVIVWANACVDDSCMDGLWMDGWLCGWGLWLCGCAHGFMCVDAGVDGCLRVDVCAWMLVWMDACVYGCLCGWMLVWLVWMDACVDGCLCGWMLVWMDVCVDRLVLKNPCVDVSVHGCLCGWMLACVGERLCG